MGVIQNSVNQALGIGALAAGKLRADYNNSVMASENVDVKLRKALYDKKLKGTITDKETEYKDKLKQKFNDRVKKYTGNSIFKNSDLRRFFESQKIDKDIATDQIENDNNKATEADIQQVMAEQQMNKVDQATEFKRNSKENVKLRKEFVKTPKAEKGKYVVNAMTLSGTYNPQDPARNMTASQAKQEMAKQMELDQKEYENKKKENK